jgi:L-ascorbate metabolism protein UlaG (beta-lactamase superfamily)
MASLADIGPIDAVLLSHDHHTDNLDEAGRALLPSANEVLTVVQGGARHRAGALLV